MQFDNLISKQKVIINQICVFSVQGVYSNLAGFATAFTFHGVTILASAKR